MKRLLIFTFFLISADGIKNYMGSSLQQCLNCVCHARTGCFNRLTCADYSINFEYWKKANSPTVDLDDDPHSRQSYDKCMNNENCVLATLDQYVDAIGFIDCNCDGKVDCKDRFAIHLFGEDCKNPKFTKIYSARFNRCAKNLGVKKMSAQEGYDGCIPEVFPDAV